MKVTSIIENTSTCNLPVEHGLSLYIELDNGQRVLFDMGQSSLFARNAETLNINIADVDLAIVSHGHYDHGGGLRTFLNLNSKAKVYVHHDAFQPHFSLRDNGLRYIGLDTELKGNDRLEFCGDIKHISEGMILFAGVQGQCCNPAGNRLLFGPYETTNDTFTHEQNLIIEENGATILFAGCAHRGIVNIIRRAEEITGKQPSHVFAGMHLANRHANSDVSTQANNNDNAFIHTLATELSNYRDTMFYTMHCTGEEQYHKLKNLLNSQIEYMACGDIIIPKSLQHYLN